MSKEITVTVALNLKPAHADSFFNDWLPELQKQTIAFQGVRAARALRQESEPTKVLFIDVFETAEAAQNYFHWREQSGDLKKLAEILTSPPKIDFWPISREPS